MFENCVKINEGRIRKSKYHNHLVISMTLPMLKSLICIVSDFSLLYLNYAKIEFVI